MKLSKELFEKAKVAKTAEELMEIAKAEKIEITLEQAKIQFERLNTKSGEIADEELDNVAGGGCKTDDGRTVVAACHYCDDHVLNGLYNKNRFNECSSCRFCSYDSGLWLCSK